MPLRLGTRSSRLALWQANWVASELHRQETPVEICPLTVSADADQRPIAEMGTVGVFTKEIQRALLEQRIDIAVHCLKDLPTVPIPGLTMAAVLPRESALDCLVGTKTLNELSEGAAVGTGSVRRRTQLLRLRPDLRVESVRGNVDTRLNKLDAGEFEALILAEAGLRRLARQDRIAETLATDQMVPAPGQGALVIETRADDHRSIAAVSELDDERTRAATDAERAVMRSLGGGCDAPIGVHAAALPADRFQLTAVVLSDDGGECLHETVDCDAAQLNENAQSVAARLVGAGAAELIRQR